MVDGVPQLGEQIRARRLELGMAQEALAELAGLRQGAISRIESGRRYPSIVTLKELLRHLHAQAVITADQERVEELAS